MPDTNSRLSEVAVISQPAFNEVVTLVIKHRIRAGMEADYEAWVNQAKAKFATLESAAGKLADAGAAR